MSVCANAVIGPCRHGNDDYLKRGRFPWVTLLNIPPPLSTILVCLKRGKGLPVLLRKQNLTFRFYYENLLGNGNIFERLLVTQITAKIIVFLTGSKMLILKFENPPNNQIKILTSRIAKKRQPTS